MSASGPLEPLEETAPLAWSQAPGLCHRDEATGDTCLWYHQVWQYLRLLGIISTVRTNTEFLIRTFRDCARAGRRVALVSGTADYSMLAHLKHAYALEGQEVVATVVDRCRTSILLNRWYADRYAVSLETTCSDALAYDRDQPFDVICTHNFLGRFDSGARARLISRWHTLLRPGGVVVTTQRIRPNSREDRVAYTEEEARQLSDRVARAARDQPLPGVDPQALAEAAYRYALGKNGYVIRTDTEIAELFVARGFDVEVADEGGPAERALDRPSSTAGKDTYRLRLVARRR